MAPLLLFMLNHGDESLMIRGPYVLMVNGAYGWSSSISVPTSNFISMSLFVHQHLSIREIFMGTTNDVISYELRDKYSTYLCWLNVATYERKLHNWKMKLSLTLISKVSFFPPALTLKFLFSTCSHCQSVLFGTLISVVPSSASSLVAVVNIITKIRI